MTGLSNNYNAAIINRNPYDKELLNINRNGGAYLNNKRPLWILEDMVPLQDLEQSVFTTHKPIFTYKKNPSKQRINDKMKEFVQKKTYLPERKKLPNHYIYNKNQNIGFGSTYKTEKKQNVRRQHLQNFRPHKSARMAMPTFDTMPTNAESETTPIFVYNGPRGQLIVNTMLSKRKYAMKEPIPGEVLHPPNVPIFRPKPIVQHFHKPSETQLNLTLIPFYAHEAINPRDLDYDTDYTTTTPAAPAPTVLYETQVQPTKKQRTSKHYDAFHSPHEVQWRPTAPTLQIVTPTTPYSMVIPSPLRNHRYNSLDDTTATTPSQPVRNFKLSYKDDEDQFQIIYVDESLEKPATYANRPTTAPFPSRTYAANKEYYAFPVLTMGNLLKPDDEQTKELINEEVILSVIILKTNAFWWNPTTTETPTVIKHIPLTYYRTYTYQPLSLNPYSYPFFGNGGYGSPQQSPLLAGARYDTFSGNFNPEFQHDVTASAITTATPAPTTSTSTTTPAPTTTTSTTTTTMTTPIVEPLLNGAPFGHYGSEFPTYNRRIYTSNYNPNYYRPHYPYPDYSSYAPSLIKSSQLPTNIQFVPCMCPVSVGVPSGQPLETQSNPIYLAQSRSTVSDEADLDLSLESDETKSKIVIEPEVLSNNAAEVNSEELHFTNKIDEGLSDKIKANLNSESEHH
ncbi:mucin-2-like [Teleopsis dalmanni]|uniref:mucin-2-like n=1 Tax=Teleopsis dalmanni TaxID=139649 RepID=UPI0018CEEC9E|nr:mucin-2-like [Teleopsis dalmanni]